MTAPAVTPLETQADLVRKRPSREDCDFHHREELYKMLLDIGKMVLMGDLEPWMIIQIGSPSAPLNTIIDRISDSVLMEGEAPYDPRVASRERFQKAHELTEKEMVVVELVVKGLTNHGIGKELWITEQTVKFHLTNIYRKMEIRNRTELASAWYAQVVPVELVVLVEPIEPVEG
jgi:DNA-binding CsgD family transcriptional regulator